MTFEEMHSRCLAACEDLVNRIPADTVIAECESNINEMTAQGKRVIQVNIFVSYDESV